MKKLKNERDLKIEQESQGRKLAKLGMKPRQALKFVNDNRKLYNSICKPCKVWWLKSSMADLSYDEIIKGYCPDCVEKVKTMYEKWTE